MASPTLTLLILCLTTITITHHCYSFKAADAVDVETKIKFYFHDTLTGKNISAVQVAGPLFNSTNPFGAVAVIDDPLTEGPELTSKQIGRAQGMYMLASMDSNLDLHLVLSIVFTDGDYKGSTLEVQGADRVLMNPREVSVVSGTGKFRFAKGYAELETSSIDGLNAVVKWTVTVRHPAFN